MLAMYKSEVTHIGRRIRRTIASLLESLDDKKSGHVPVGPPKDKLYDAAVTLAMKCAFDFHAEQRGWSRPSMSEVYGMSCNAQDVPLPQSIADRIAATLRQTERPGKHRGQSRPLDWSALEVEDIGYLYESLLHHNARRRGGIHYTPRSLTERTVEYALEPLVYHGPLDEAPRSRWKLRSADEILNLRICDIACGCGAFLIQACRYLSQRLLETWGVSDQSRAIQARQLVARHCLFGVDTDAAALAIAKQSVWLLCEARSELRTLLDRRIRRGDSLIAAPVPGLNVEHPFDWQREFPDEFADGGGFHAIIGNPPYVSLFARESQAANFADPFEAYAKQHLGHLDGKAVLTGRINTYLLFLVRSLQLLHPTCGIAALVLPDTILTNESYEPMRRALTESGRLVKAVRYQAPMFRGATVGTAIAVCGTPSRRRHVTFVEEAAGDGIATAVHEPIHSVARRTHCTWLAQKSSHIAHAALPTGTTVPIDEFAFVKDGINPGARETRQWLLTDEPDDDASLRLCMEGNWIKPFQIHRKRRWVRYDPSRLSPTERKAGASLRNAWIFDSPKIVYRQTAPHIIAAIDYEGLCARNSVHCVILKNHNDVVLHALLAYLNSEVCLANYQSLTGETRKTFPQVHISSVKKLRVPERILDPLHPDTKRLANLARSSSINIDEREAALAPRLAAAKSRINTLVARIAKPGNSSHCARHSA
jgi:methylase of polypeptide subunit release factors